MEQKKPFAQRVEAFFAGKGFYIVLFLCVAVIGVSAWSMLAEDGTDVDAPIGFDDSLSQPEEDVPTAVQDEPVFGEHDAADYQEDQPVSNLQESSLPEDTQPDEPADAPAPTPTAQAAPTAQSIPGYFVWPVTGQIENPWSMTALVYNRTMRDWRTHDGMDIAAELGTQVRATADGVVEEVYNDDLYGTTVIIAHSGGLKSIYCNLAASPTVSVGDAVAAGSVIGSVGDSALCETGEVTHLHFAMSLDGESVDPAEYMP